MIMIEKPYLNKWLDDTHKYKFKNDIKVILTLEYEATLIMAQRGPVSITFLLFSNIKKHSRKQLRYFVSFCYMYHSCYLIISITLIDHLKKQYS